MNEGQIVQVIGPVVDIEFDRGRLPAIFNALRLTNPRISDKEGNLIVEVAQHIGQNTVRCVAMDTTDGLVRGMKAVDTEDITTLARSIRGVEMVLFFKEMSPGTFRVSLRSKGRANAARVAEHFGGGGHIHASGFTVYGPYERLIAEIPRTVEALLDEALGEDSVPSE